MQLVVGSLVVGSWPIHRHCLVDNLEGHKQWPVVQLVRMFVQMKELLVLVVAVHMKVLVPMQVHMKVQLVVIVVVVHKKPSVKMMAVALVHMMAKMMVGLQCDRYTVAMAKPKMLIVNRLVFVENS